MHLKSMHGGEGEHTSEISRWIIQIHNTSSSGVLRLGPSCSDFMTATARASPRTWNCWQSMRICFRLVLFDGWIDKVLESTWFVGLANPQSLCLTFNFMRRTLNASMQQWRYRRHQNGQNTQVLSRELRENSKKSFDLSVVAVILAGFGCRRLLECRNVFLYENCLINKFVLLLLGLYGHIVDGGSKQALPWSCASTTKSLSNHISCLKPLKPHFGFFETSDFAHQHMGFWKRGQNSSKFKLIPKLIFKKWPPWNIHWRAVKGFRMGICADSHPCVSLSLFETPSGGSERRLKATLGFSIRW